MVKSSSNPEDTVFGVSPLGGNSVEGTGADMAEVRSTAIEGVPLVWDDRVHAFISEQAKEELDDRDISELAREEHQDELNFMERAGIGRS